MCRAHIMNFERRSYTYSEHAFKGKLAAFSFNKLCPMHFVSTSRTAQRSWEKARDRTREGGKARAGLSWFNEAFPNASGMDLCHSLTAYGEVLGILPWSPLMQSNMLYMHGIGLWHCINQYPVSDPDSKLNLYCCRSKHACSNLACTKEQKDLQARKEEMRAQDQRRMDIMAQKQEAFQDRVVGCCWGLSLLRKTNQLLPLAGMLPEIAAGLIWHWSR